MKAVLIADVFPDEHDRARRLTLAVAVRDAAAGRLDAQEIREALQAAQVSREDFDHLVRIERIRKAGNHAA